MQQVRDALVAADIMKRFTRLAAIQIGYPESIEDVADIVLFCLSNDTVGSSVPLDHPWVLHDSLRRAKQTFIIVGSSKHVIK